MIRSFGFLPLGLRALGRIVSLVALMAIAGCSQSALEPTDPNGNVVISDIDNWRKDPFVSNSAVIEGHELIVEVSYGGGCRTHTFTLVISESFRESDPVQLPALLAHDANEDPCQAWLTESLVFDLELVRTRYREVYGNGPGTIVLSIDGVSENDLVYSFPG